MVLVIEKHQIGLCYKLSGLKREVMLQIRAHLHLATATRLRCRCDIAPNRSQSDSPATSQSLGVTVQHQNNWERCRSDVAVAACKWALRRLDGVSPIVSLTLKNTAIQMAHVTSLLSSFESSSSRNCDAKSPGGLCACAGACALELPCT